MTRSEAISIFKLPEKFEREELKKSYFDSYISAYRRKSVAMTIVEMESEDSQIERINSANAILSNIRVKGKRNLQFDFVADSPSGIVDIEHHGASKKLEYLAQELLQKKKHGLCFRLLELGIKEYSDTSGKSMNFDLTMAYRLLGKVMIEMGLINQGMPFYNYGLSHYERGRSFMLIGDYRSALHYMGKELTQRETDIPYDEVCQLISICYFLVGEYNNALDVIEEILPQFLPKKQIFEDKCKSKKFATSVMVSMYKNENLEGSNFDLIKIKMKYPLSSKYLQTCYGKYSEAFKIIDEFENDSDKYDDFLNSLKPKNPVKENIESDYSIDELQKLYLELFDEPLEKSLIYNPK